MQTLVPSPSNAPTQRARFNVECYDLDATLDSGQAFRWKRVDHGWQGVIDTALVELRSTEGHILAEWTSHGTSRARIEDYLQTRIPIQEILETFPDDPVMRQALNSCRGLRLLRQPPWECLIAFILSSAKRIPHIQSMVHALSKSFGSPIDSKLGAYAFPTPTQLHAASESELRTLSLGFRARYVAQTTERILEEPNFLKSIQRLDYLSAREQLMTLPGVGHKIANCVLLFAYGFGEAFPIDTWIARALDNHYPNQFTGSAPKMAQQIRDYFGPYSGYAQQYLFHAIRAGRLQTSA